MERKKPEVEQRTSDLEIPIILKSEKQNEREQKNQSSEHRSRFVSHSGFSTSNDCIVEPIGVMLL